MGMQRSCADELAGSTPTVNLLAAKRLLRMLGALDVNGLVRKGKKWQRWVTIRVYGNAGEREERRRGCYRGKNCPILEEPPRMGNSDLGVAFLRINPPGSNVVSNC